MSNTSQLQTFLRLVSPFTASLIVVLGATPASAHPDPGPSLPGAANPVGCLLQRVGTQLVRCDDLTGNGVSAPAFVRER